MKKNDASGVLLVDKPIGISSAAVISRLQKKWNWAKVGHGGTLDPFASGLMVVLVGEATKISRFFLGGEKTYLATAKIGIRTETGDLEGNPLAESAIRPSLSEWQNSTKNFLGEILQKPPAYSALKINGKPAYARARAGEKLDLAPRPVQIQSLTALDLRADELDFRVNCGGGTYIRTLAEDLAKDAGTEAHLLRLRREECCGFSLDQASPLSVCEAEEPKMLSLVKALPKISRLTLPASQILLIRQGQRQALAALEAQAGALVKNTAASLNTVADPSRSLENFFFLLDESLAPDSCKQPSALLEWNPASSQLEIARVFQLQ